MGMDWICPACDNKILSGHAHTALDCLSVVRGQRDAANLQVERCRKALVDIIACHAASSEPTHTRMVSVIAEATLRYLTHTEKPKHDHIWYADPTRGPGSFCRDCNEVWLPGVGEKRVEESPKPYQRGDDVSDDAMMG